MSLDVWGLPEKFRGDVQTFTRPCTVTNLQWETWRKPRGISMCQIIAIGGGAGGGGGFTAAAAAARGGGGGGGSSGISRVTVPALWLPDILYVQVGAGGAGGAAGATGGNGVLSYVAAWRDIAADNVVAISGAAAASGGGGGTGAAAGSGAAGSTIAVIGSMPIAGCGNFDLIAGQSGANGGVQTGAVGSSITLPVTSARCSGGAGGAGVTAADFAGGGFAGAANTYLSEQRPVASAAGSFDGSGGPAIMSPFMMFGGCGGSSSNAGVGGNGGPAAYGAGGGGGGGGTTGGRGGPGGQGIVMIVSW